MPEPAWFHLTARAVPGVPSLTRADTGHWLWTWLRVVFAEAIAAVLMPDHLHLVIATIDARREAQRLARLLGHFGRRFGVQGQVSRVADPQRLADRQKLERQVRYAALNPCRKRLIECPLAWKWSTHRDVIGAIAKPWVDADRLARVLARPRDDFAARHHAYVSGDPHVDVRGTAFPSAAASCTVPSVPLTTIVAAATSALCVPTDAVRSRGPARTLFVALAHDQGWRDARLLAEACDCGPHAIRRAEPVDARSLAAARLCLGDERLRRPARAAFRAPSDRERAG